MLHFPFSQCNRDEDHCRRMLQTFNSPTSHPDGPGRQFSAPSTSTPSEETVNIPKRILPDSVPLIPQPVPQPAQSSPSQPAATINLTLDDIMRLLHMTADQYDGRTMPYRPQPRYPPMARGRGGTVPRMHFPPPAPHPVDLRPPTLSSSLPGMYLRGHRQWPLGPTVSCGKVEGCQISAQFS